MASFAWQLLVACVLAAALPLAAASKPEETVPPNIEALMELSGLNRQLAQIAPLILAGMDQATADGAPGYKKLTPTQAARLRSGVGKAFAPAALRAACRRAMAESLLPAEQEAVLQWLRGDLGKRITAIEVRAEEGLLTAEAQAARAEAEKKYEKVASARRMALTRRIMNASMAAESGATMYVNIFIGVAYGTALAAAPEMTNQLDAMRAELEKTKPDLTAAMRESLPPTMAYTYRTLSEDELERYAVFIESAPGQSFSAAAVQGLDRAFAAGGLELGLHFGEALARDTPAHGT